MRSDVAFYLAIGAVVLIALSLLPGSITGNVILEDGACSGIGCDQLCEPAENTCGGGLVCCPGWEAGLCDFPENCVIIAKQSTQVSLEEFIIAREEEPSEIRNMDSNYFLVALLMAAAVVFAIVFYAKKKEI